MPRPVISVDTDILYGMLPWWMTDQDEALGWPLLTYLESIGQQLQVVDTLGRDDATGRPGWQTILNLNEAPADGLGYLAQFVGVELLQGLDDAHQRQRISDTAGFRRGSPAAIVAAAQQYLTGTQRVDLYERDGGDAYHFRLRTFAVETPDSAAVQAAVLAQKPGGLTWTYELAPGATYAEIDAKYGTYADMKATNLTYEDLKASMP